MKRILMVLALAAVGITYAAWPLCADRSWQSADGVG